MATAVVEWATVDHHACHSIDPRTRDTGEEIALAALDDWRSDKPPWIEEFFARLPEGLDELNAKNDRRETVSNPLGSILGGP